MSSGRVGQEDVQQFGRADAVEDVDAEARLPGIADRFRQRFAGGGADAQALAAARAFFTVSSLNIAANSVGTPKKMVGLYLFRSANIRAGVGRSEFSTVLAPTDIGKVSALPSP